MEIFMNISSTSSQTTISTNTNIQIANQIEGQNFSTQSAISSLAAHALPSQCEDAKNLKIPPSKLIEQAVEKNKTISAIFHKFSNEQLEKMSAEGDAQAKFTLALRYLEGQVLKKDPEKCFAFAKEAAEKGHLYALSIYGNHLLRGLGCKAEPQKAFHILKQAVEKGSYISWNDIAYCYKQGLGCEKSLEKAFQWYKLAAEVDGSGNSECALAECYQEGLGCQKDLKEAVKWYTKAAEKNNPEAQYQLATCLLLGEGCDQNPDLSFAWFKKAANNNHSVAQCMLGILLKDAIGTEQALDESFQCFESSAAQDFYPAFFLIGYCYEKGISVEKNPEKALYWYTKGEARADQMAEKALKRLAEQEAKK